MSRPRKEISNIHEIGNRYTSTKIGLQKLSKIYEVPLTTLYKRLLEEGFKMKYNTGKTLYRNKRHDYFDVIDNEEKAYYLGLLWADGHNDINGRYVAIQLQEQDGYILERLCKLIFKETGPLKIREKRKIKGFKGQWLNVQRMFSLNISSIHMCKTLLSYGMTARKSFDLEFPAIGVVPEHLIHHFMRGYFDGDGWISTHIRRGNQKRLTWGIMGSVMFCEQYNALLHQYSTIIANSHIMDYSEPMMNIITSSNHSIYHIYKFLYKDASVYLKRKRNVIMGSLNQLRKGKPNPYQYAI